MIRPSSVNSIVIQALGLLFFGALFWMAWIFFKERMLAFDPAFFSFKIVRSQSYNVELNRWGAVFSQWLPITFLKRGCSLETFLRVYSVSFIIVYYLIFLIITLGLKNNRLGLALMITLCLAFRHAFYYSTAELYPGMALCILIWALIIRMKNTDSKKQKTIFWLSGIVLVYVVSYHHQLTALALLFIVLFEIISEKEYRNPWMIGFLLITAAWFFVRIKFLTTSDYESGKIPTVAVFKEQLPKLTHLPSFNFLIQYAKEWLRPFIIVMAVCAFFMLKEKKWLLLFFVTTFIGGFLLLNIITYYSGEAPVMYENYLTMLGLFGAVTLCRLIKNIYSNKWAISLTVLLLIWNVKSIYSCHYPFSERVNYLERLTSEGHKYPEKKYLIDKNNFPWLYGWIDWALPFETLLYSSLSGPDSSITVHCATSINQYDNIINDKNIFLSTRWAINWFWSNDLNETYFHLPPTGYRKLASSQSDSTFDESIFTKDNISIIPKSVSIPYYETIVIPVTVVNRSGHRVRSLPDIKTSVNLSYHIYNDRNELLFFDGHRTILETDILNQSEQAIVVVEKLLRGKYFIDVDFITEHKRWWGINARAELIVK